MRWQDRSVHFEQGHAVPEKLRPFPANATEPDADQDDVDRKTHSFEVKHVESSWVRAPQLTGLPRRRSLMRQNPIRVRQVKYLNNIVEQDHRAIKRMTRPMLNSKSFRSAISVLAGIELMHMIRKGQFAVDDTAAMFFADQFYALAGQVVQRRPRSCSA